MAFQNAEERAEYMHEWRANNREKTRGYSRKYYSNNRDDERARSAVKYQVNRERRGVPRPTRLMPDCCECCDKPRGERVLNLDHCHDTGIFRGWLCMNCNTGIGKLDDSISGLVRAIEYLKRTN